MIIVIIIDLPGQLYRSCFAIALMHTPTRARRAHTPRAMVHCECYRDGFDLGEIRSIEHAQDSLVQACAEVSIGVSGIGVATMDNKKALFVTLVDHVSRFEAY